MAKITKYTIYLDDNEGSSFQECTNIKPTAEGLAFTNGNGLKCLTNLHYFIREESTIEKS